MIPNFLVFLHTSKDASHVMILDIAKKEVRESKIIRPIVNPADAIRQILDINFQLGWQRGHDMTDAVSILQHNLNDDIK